ncbi:HD domain-containing phosphohydrolase [Chloroflexota bacterium]
MENIITKEAQLNKTRIDLLEKIWNKVKSGNEEEQLIAGIMRVTDNALSASASSLLFLDDKNQELYFRYANGPVGDHLKRLHISRKSGIAGWIVRNGKPLIVNDAKKNHSFYKDIDEATGFKTRSIIGVPLILQNKVIGVIEVLNKTDGTDFNKRDLQTLTNVATTAAMAIENVRLNISLKESYKSTVKELVSLADARETNAGGHSRRVSEYASIGASELSFSKEEKQALEFAAMLHDIGKLSIPDNILNKTHTLTNEEWEIIYQHPVTGYNLLKGIPFLKDASKLILYHHERYDGNGYPHGLKGENIPIGARLIAVADAFDHMTSDHTYRSALDKRFAFTELKKYALSQFCPVAVKAFNAGFVKSRLSEKSNAGLSKIPIIAQKH